MEAVEELVKYLGPEGRNWIETDEYKNLEKLNKYLDTLFGEEYGAKPRSTTATRAAIPSAAVQKPAPQPVQKYSATKKAVEEELRKADIIKLEAQKLLGLLQG